MYKPHYTYHCVDGKKVICVSHYAGKPVRGIAKCDPKDTFDIECGKKLSRVRCDYKIAKKRAYRARDNYTDAAKNLKDAQEHYEKMRKYYTEAFKEFIDLYDDLNKLESELA